MARGKTVLLRLDKAERGAFAIAVHRGKRAIEHHLRLVDYDEPDELLIAAAEAKLDGAEEADGQIDVSLTFPEALQLEIAADIGLQVILSQNMVANTGPMERALEKLKAAAR